MHLLQLPPKIERSTLNAVNHREEMRHSEENRNAIRDLVARSNEQTVAIDALNRRMNTLIDLVEKLTPKDTPAPQSSNPNYDDPPAVTPPKSPKKSS